MDTPTDIEWARRKVALLLLRMAQLIKRGIDL